MAEKVDIWMPLYIGDFLGATAHLDAAETGAYLLLLMHQWKNGDLPAQEEYLRRVARVGESNWKAVWDVLKVFFDFSLGHPVQLRLESIRSECERQKELQVSRATTAARKRWGRPTEASAADAEGSASVEPVPPGDSPMLEHRPSMPFDDAQAMLKQCPSSSSSPPLEKQRAPGVAGVALPVWCDERAWEGYVDMRRRTRRPLTQRAAEILLGELERLVSEGNNPTDVMNRATVGNWTTFYDLKGKGNGHGKTERNSTAGARRESPPHQRQRESRDAIRGAVERRLGHRVGGDDGAGTGEVLDADAAGGRGGHDAARMGDAGAAVRAGDVQGRVVEGRR